MKSNELRLTLETLDNEIKSRKSKQLYKFNRMKYEEVRKDWEYLFKEIEEANNKTVFYEDSKDLELMLTNPTKIQAKKCMIGQIKYWFRVGPDTSYLHQNNIPIRSWVGNRQESLILLSRHFPRVLKLYEKYM